ncbi:MAG: 3-deoxy-7-phosphoheptulonate synthase class II [Candidatus Helarchaeota archaeon]
MTTSWTKNSWRKFPIRQQPQWPDKNKLNEVLSKLKGLPSLVFSEETRRLKKELTKVNTNKNFILQVGHCSESFTDCNGPKIHNYLRILLQMAIVLEYKTRKKVIKIGRIAGQYAKPRSSDFEVIDGEKIPSYRGDIINDFGPTSESRTPKPEKLLEGYYRSASTLNLIRAFTQGGYSDINNLSDWKEHFFSEEISNLEYYRTFEKDISNSLKNTNKFLQKTKKRDIIFISHEALLLDYEEVFTRIDTIKGGYYATSAHLLWIGDRTRQLDGGHVEFVRGIGNPIGIKIGPSYKLNEIIKIIKKINPKNEEGKIVLIMRLGVNRIDSMLRPLIRAIKDCDLQVIWICDPMHGNTFKYNNYKVRSFKDIVSETSLFFRICKEEKVVPGGIHLEITEEYVTECIGGLCGLNLSNLSDNYVSKVDPRLNAAQALEMAFIVSELVSQS